MNNENKGNTSLTEKPKNDKPKKEIPKNEEPKNELKNEKPKKGKGDNIPRSRSWFIVIHEGNFTTEICYDNLKEYVQANLKNVRYFCYNLEVTKEGKLHMHLYIELANATAQTRVIKLFNKSHVEPRRGTPSDARNYILKPVGMFFKDDNEEKWHTLKEPMLEFGDFSKYASTEIEGRLKLNLNEKMEVYLNEFDTLEEIEIADLWFAKHFKNEIQRRINLKKKEELISKCGVYIKIGNKEVLTYRKKIYYLQGESRIGKTLMIYAKYDKDNVFRANCDNPRPFDNYNGQKVLLLDEFRGQISLDNMLSLLDCYDYTLSCRNADRELLSDTIILSSNLHFEELYRNVYIPIADRQAFKNRFVNGIWEMCRDNQTKRLFVHCMSKRESFTNFAKDLVEFSEPPIYSDNESIFHITDDMQYYTILEMIKEEIPTNDNNIKKSKRKDSKWLDKLIEKKRAKYKSKLPY